MIQRNPYLASASGFRFLIFFSNFMILRFKKEVWTGYLSLSWSLHLNNSTLASTENFNRVCQTMQLQEVFITLEKCYHGPEALTMNKKAILENVKSTKIFLELNSVVWSRWNLIKMIPSNQNSLSFLLAIRWLWHSA